MQQKPPLDMAHILGIFLEVGGTIAAFLLSALLSYMFFSTIAPKNMGWFAYAAMALTEGGFIIWIGVFMLKRHNPFKKVVAMLMAGACALASFTVAGSELDILLNHIDIAHDAGLYSTITTVLELIFALHIITFIVSMFHSYFSKPGNNFRNPGNLIPTNRNLIPMYAPGLNPPAYTIEELQQLNNTITGYIEAARNGGETANPLASNQPQSTYTPVSLPNVGTYQPPQQINSLGDLIAVAKEVGSSLTRKGKGAKRNTSQADRAPGPANGTTSGGTSTNENPTDE